MIGGPRKRAEQNLAYSPRVASGVIFLPKTSFLKNVPAKSKRDLESGDRVEVFFSSTPDLSLWYHCAEIDPRGRVLDYRVRYPRQFDYGWSFRTLECRAERTAKGYRVEGSVALSELRELGVNPNQFWLGAFRADYDERGNLVAWCSLLPPGPGMADFHRPCMLFKASWQ